jgi:hypothetical protein
MPIFKIQNFVQYHVSTEKVTQTQNYVWINNELRTNNLD